MNPYLQLTNVMRLSEKEARAKEAAAWRRMRKTNPHLARLLWKMRKGKA